MAEGDALTSEEMARLTECEEAFKAECPELAEQLQKEQPEQRDDDARLLALQQVKNGTFKKRDAIGQSFMRDTQGGNNLEYTSAGKDKRREMEIRWAEMKEDEYQMSKTKHTVNEKADTSKGEFFSLFALAKSEGMPAALTYCKNIWKLVKSRAREVY